MDEILSEAKKLLDSHSKKIDDNRLFKIIEPLKQPINGQNNTDTYYYIPGTNISMTVDETGKLQYRFNHPKNR